MLDSVSSMLVTDVGDQMCWWQVWDVSDRFRMLVTDLIHWGNYQHHKVTNITMSPTSLSPLKSGIRIFNFFAGRSDQLFCPWFPELNLDLQNLIQMDSTFTCWHLSCQYLGHWRWVSPERNQFFFQFGKMNFNPIINLFQVYILLVLVVPCSIAF